jgi:hypothetical protein
VRRRHRPELLLALLHRQALPLLHRQALLPGLLPLGLERQRKLVRKPAPKLP